MEKMQQTWEIYFEVEFIVPSIQFNMGEIEEIEPKMT